MTDNERASAVRALIAFVGTVGITWHLWGWERALLTWMVIGLLHEWRPHGRL